MTILAGCILMICFLGVVLYALYSKADVTVNLSVFRKLFEFSIHATGPPKIHGAPDGSHIAPTTRLEAPREQV